jgi:hypothetical protein
MTSIHARWRTAACAAALMALSSAAAAGPAYVKSTVNLRSAPGTENEIVGKIPGGSLVEANNCENGWCAVDWQGKSGYAIQTALDTSGRVPAVRRVTRSAPPPATYYEDDDFVVASPFYFGPAVGYYRYPYRYRSYGYYRYRPYGYRYGGWRRRW